MTLPIDPGEAIVVVGALATRPPDRNLQRDEIRPVQVFTADGVEPVPALDRGEFGMSSLVIRAEAGVVYGSSGNDFFRLDLAGGAITDLGIDLQDSHEVTEIDGELWIANTGRDEAVAFDLATEKVARRVAVRSRGNAAGASPATDPRDTGETVDKFHANQIVRCLDGKLYVLVHHVDGKQIVKYVAQRLVKMQGNGGVIELETGRPVPLALSGPHSIQAVGADEQWICDSRAGVLRVYDRGWREHTQIPCAGWGRGVSVSLCIRGDLVDPQAVPAGDPDVAALGEHAAGLRPRRPHPDRRDGRPQRRDDQQRLRGEPRDGGALAAGHAAAGAPGA